MALLVKHGELLLLALSFYTRIPVAQNLNYGLLAKANRYLPVIGWLVGGVSALVFSVAALIWPTTVAVVLSLVVGVLLTGGFHEDGFADVCDGFGASADKQRILAIMKDSSLGSYGVLGLILLMILKISLLSAYPATMTPWVILAGHSMSRLMPLLIMRRYDYARSEAAKSGSAVAKPGLGELVFAGACALLPMMLLPGLCWLALIPLLVINQLLSRYFYRKINGYTGDCLGASQQLAEVGFYLSGYGLWTFI